MSNYYLQFFSYQHLPPHLQSISKPLCEIAVQMDALLPSNPEKDEFMRKLLEAKDCAVRAELIRDKRAEVTA